MADNEYKIVIQLPSEQQSKVMSTNNPTAAPAKTSSEKRAEGAASALKSMVSFSAVRAFADNLISYEISQVELRTGAREYEQKLRFGYQVANQGINILAATAMGFATGNIAGAVVGFLGSTLYTAIGYAQNYNTIRTQENLENVSIGLANLRAGVSGRRGRTQ